ncbi:MAG: hypothetical protein CME70_12660 [Halobacteriovorax sp.]|nr:hypothetical protein [Halobacteriovorax sp.]|tara:strand:- start:201559 stop:202029 length:471 start_codon:yes stop_codon:yes gene_type:complete
MKSLFAIFAICFSLNVSSEGLESINQEFLLDDPAGLEFGFPHEMYLERIKVQPELFGDTTVRMIGMANDQPFDLVRRVKNRGQENNQFHVEAIVWSDNIGGSACDEEIIKKIKLSFKVDKKTHKTSEHRFTATRLYTYDNCHSPFSIKEFYYSLMK